MAELKWIDTHAHYNHGKFKGRGKDMIVKVTKDVEKIINVGTNTKSNLETLQLVSTYDHVYGIIGYFPTDVWELEHSLYNGAQANWLVLQKQLTNDKIVAVGEIGLDYNWDKVGNLVFGEDARNLQQKWFRKQIEIAKAANLPICVHSRDAEDDTVKIFKEYDELPGVIHCYAYGKNTARVALDKGLYLGVGGTSTYARNIELREVIKMCPIDRILLETDCPYLSPEPVRRETNNSSFITYVIDNICSLKNMSRDDVISATNENAYRLFNFGGK